jgi:biopolymer transport protein ExbD
MNLRQKLGRDRQVKNNDVNIIGVMNVFLLIIPFLLMTAAFIRLAAVDLSLPSLGKGRGPTDEPPKNLVLVILVIRETGFQLKSSLDVKFDPIEINRNQYNYSKLVEQLKVIKERQPQAEDVIISPDAKVKYDVIIKVMDRCRETGFSNVSLSG